MKCDESLCYGKQAAINICTRKKRLKHREVVIISTGVNDVWTTRSMTHPRTSYKWHSRIHGKLATISLISFTVVAHIPILITKSHWYMKLRAVHHDLWKGKPLIQFARIRNNTECRNQVNTQILQQNHFKNALLFCQACISSVVKVCISTFLKHSFCHISLIKIKVDFEKSLSCALQPLLLFARRYDGNLLFMVYSYLWIQTYPTFFILHIYISYKSHPYKNLDFA